jgi:hypothetical protein
MIVLGHFQHLFALASHSLEVSWSNFVHYQVAAAPAISLSMIALQDLRMDMILRTYEFEQIGL